MTSALLSTFDSLQLLRSLVRSLTLDRSHSPPAEKVAVSLNASTAASSSSRNRFALFSAAVTGSSFPSRRLECSTRFDMSPIRHHWHETAPALLIARVRTRAP